MTTPLGGAYGFIQINTKPALAALAQLRAQNARTIGALNTTSRATIRAGRGITTIGLVAAAAIGVAINQSAKLEKRLSYIKGITALNEDQMNRLREKVIQLGQDSAYTANEVADGFTELAKAGGTIEDMVGGLGEAMITLGQSSDISLDKAATALISIKSTFGLAIKDSAHIADILQGAANSSIISVEDMGVSFKYAGGVAANLGVSLEDTATAIAILGNAGIRGSTAGTSLRRIFLQLTPRTKKAEGAMKALGIITEDGSNRFYDATGKAKKLSEITEILRQSTKKLTPEMRQKALATIFGDRAINSAIALSKGGSKEFDRMYKIIGNVKAADVAAERLNNLAGAWEIFKGTVDSALIRSGGPLQESLKGIVEKLTDMVNKFNELSPATQKAIVKIALFGTGITLLAGGLLTVAGLLLRAKMIIKELKIAFLVLRARFITFLGAASGGIITALFTTPIGWLILAVIAMAAAFVIAWKRSAKFRERVRELAAEIKDKLHKAFIATVNYIQTKVIPFLKVLWGIFKKEVTPAIRDAGKMIKEQFIKTLESLRKSWRSIKTSVIDALHSINKTLGGSANGTETLKKKIVSAIKTATKWFGIIVGWVIKFGARVIVTWLKVAAIMGKVLAFIIKYVAKFVAWLFKAGKWTWNAMKDVGQAFSDAWDWIKTKTSEFVGWLGDAWNWVVNKFSQVKDALSAFLDRPMYYIGFAIGFIIGLFAKLVGFIVGAIVVLGWKVLKGFWGFLQKVPGYFKTALGWAKDQLMSFTGWLLTDGLDLLLKFVQGFWNHLKNLPGYITTATTWMIEKMVAFAPVLAKHAASLGWSLLKGVWHVIEGLPGMVWDLLGKVIDMFKNMVQAGWDAAKGFAQGIWDGFKTGIGLGDAHSGRPIDPSGLSVPVVPKNTDPTKNGTTAPVPGAGRTGEGVRRATTVVTNKTTNVTVNNPKAEKSSKDIPRVLRNIDFVGG